MSDSPLGPSLSIPPSGTRPSFPPSMTPFQRAMLSQDIETLRYLRHALRTPLNQIIGYSEMILESLEKGGAELEPDLKRIHTAGGQLLALFNDALAPWKIETGRIDLPELRREALTPLNAIVGYSEMCQEQALEAGLTVLEEDLKKISLAGSNLHRVFESEFPDSVTGGSPSANLGVAAQAVLGDTSEINLTFAPFDTVAGFTAKPNIGRILVVDDDPLNRDMLARRLERFGHTVITAENGRAALGLLRQEKCDLVLLDILMPELNGFQTLELIKAHGKLRELPVIMLTALDEVDSTARCLDAGAEDYVPKPFNPIILRARINASLDKKRLRDLERAFMAELQTERAKSERLLLNTLPKAIADRLKAGERTIVDSFRDATVLFADIVGFSRISAEMAPGRTVQLLNDLYSAFDRLAEMYALEKIKTMGDSYMAVGGVPTVSADHAEACAEMALAMLVAVQQFNRRNGLNWALRLGLHTGPLVAGIIGTKKFSYDLWGDTVNIASRMESHGEPGRIQISATTRRLLGAIYLCEERGAIELKNRGVMQVYHLVGRTRPEPKPGASRPAS